MLGHSSLVQCLCVRYMIAPIRHIVPVVSVYLICIARQQRQTAETVSTLSALLAAGSRKSGIRLAWTREVLKLPGGECYQTLYQVNTNEWDINLSFWGMSLADFLFKYLLRLWKIWNVEVNIGLSPLDGPYLDRWPETGDWRWTRNAEVDLQLGILHTLPSVSSTLK